MNSYSLGFFNNREYSCQFLSKKFLSFGTICNNAQFDVEQTAWIWQKIMLILSNTLRLKFYYLKIIDILHPRYQSKIKGHILINKQKCLYSWDYKVNHDEKWRQKWKINMTYKYRYDINRPRSGHEHKYSGCKVSQHDDAYRY